METSILEDLGLTKGEIKVYLTLLEIGETKVGQIIDKSNMVSSAVHNAINSLVEKGLISYIKKGQIKYYKAAEPKQLLDFIEDKKKKFLELIPELESRQQISRDHQEAEIFEGVKGVIVMFKKLIDGAKKGDNYYFFATRLDKENKDFLEFFNKNEDVQNFFIKYEDASREKIGLITKALSPKDLRGMFTGNQFSRRKINVRYTNLPIPNGISMCNDKIAIVSWTEKPIGYLIKSRQIYTMFQKYFNEIWNIS